MALPIPEILKNAAQVIIEAKKVCNDGQNDGVADLRRSLEKVTPEDLKAVMDEVGATYFGFSNLQIRQIASAPDFQQKKFALVLIMEPLGLQAIQPTLPLTIEQAQQLIRSFQDTLKSLTLTEGKLILNSGNA